MRPPRLRLSLRIRTLLLLVALAALVIGGWQMWPRWEYCIELALDHEKTADEISVMANLVSPFSTTTQRAKDQALIQGKAERRRRFAKQYRHVARYPWLPLPREPD